MLITAKADIRPPTAPVLGTPTPLSSSSMNVPLTTASTDLVAVASYSLERATSAGGTYTEVTSAASFPYADTGLSASTTYYYRARATDTSGNVGTYSAIVSGTTSAGSSGSFVDGIAGYVFTPPSGSANTLPYQFWGGKASAGGNLDAGTHNTAVAKTSWTTSVVMPRYDNTRTRTRSKSMGFSSLYTKASNPGNSGAFALGFDMGLSFGEYLFEGDVFMDCNTSTNLTDLQLKLHRLTFIDDIQDSFTAYYTGKRGVGGASDFLAYPQGGLVERLDGGYSNGTNYFGSVGSYQHGERFPNIYPAWNTGRWYRYRFWSRPGTGTNTNDGQWTLDMWRLDTGAKVVTNYDINARTYVDSRRGRWFELQNYHGNAAPTPPGGDGTANNTTNFEIPGDGRAFWENVKLIPGTGCRREIIGTNASTWAASTDWHFQPWSSWTSGAVTLTPNNPLGNVTHLYEINSSGDPVNTNGTAV